MPTLIIVIIYVLICAKTVSDEQIEKTYVMYIFLQTRHILSRILKKIGTVQKRRIKIAHGKCQLSEIMSGLLLGYRIQIYLTALVDKQFISQDYLQSKT